MSPVTQSPELSVIVPVHDEAECIGLLHDRLTPVLKGLGVRYEILFVDDGSKDASLDIIRGLQSVDPSVGGVALTRNFGHQAALTAGLAVCRGQGVVTMDADLQHPPELIPELVAAWKKGAKVVHAVRVETQGIGALKRLTSGLYYRLLSLLSDVSPRSDAADFRLLDRAAVDALAQMDERQRFLRGMIGWLGLPEEQVVFSAPARAAGHSKYGWRKMWSLAVDGIVSSSIKPLRASLWLGFMALLADMVYALYVLHAYLYFDVIRGWSSLILVSLFLGGIHLVLLGVVGEYVGRIYEEVKGRPHYVLKELLPPRAS